MVTGWLFPLLIVVLIAALGVGWWLGVKRSSGTGVAVAHTKRAREHPRFRRRLQILRVALGSILAVGLLGGVTSSYLAARPSGDVSLESKLATRDIMLCLDVSGSVIDFDAQVVKSFSEIVKDFEGERVGLAMWNSGTRLVFPLTSDYELVINQLDYVARALSDPYNYDGYYDLVAGTSAGYTYGSSLIGDGLVSCAQSFDQEEDERSHSRRRPSSLPTRASLCTDCTSLADGWTTTRRCAKCSNRAAATITRPRTQQRRKRSWRPFRLRTPWIWASLAKR